MAGQAKVRSVQCRRCGCWFEAPAKRGRPPVVCDTCRSAHAAEQTAQRVRRWRGQAQARAEEEAFVRERQAQYHARRLARLYPEAAAILASEIPSGLATDVIKQLKGGAGERRGKNDPGAADGEE